MHTILNTRVDQAYAEGRKAELTEAFRAGLQVGEKGQQGQQGPPGGPQGIPGASGPPGTPGEPSGPPRTEGEVIKQKITEDEERKSNAKKDQITAKTYCNSFNGKWETCDKRNICLYESTQNVCEGIFLKKTMVDNVITGLTKLLNFFSNDQSINHSEFFIKSKTPNKQTCIAKLRKGIKRLETHKTEYNTIFEIIKVFIDKFDNEQKRIQEERNSLSIFKVKKYSKYLSEFRKEQKKNLEVKEDANDANDPIGESEHYNSISEVIIFEISLLDNADDLKQKLIKIIVPDSSDNDLIKLKVPLTQKLIKKFKLIEKQIIEPLQQTHLKTNFEEIFKLILEEKDIITYSRGFNIRNYKQLIIHFKTKIIEFIIIIKESIENILDVIYKEFLNTLLADAKTKLLLFFYGKGNKATIIDGFYEIIILWIKFLENNFKLLQTKITNNIENIIEIEVCLDLDKSDDPNQDNLFESLKKVINKIRKNKKEKEYLDTVFLTDLNEELEEIEEYLKTADIKTQELDIEIKKKFFLKEKLEEIKRDYEEIQDDKKLKKKLKKELKKKLINKFLLYKLFDSDLAFIFELSKDITFSSLLKLIGPFNYDKFGKKEKCKNNYYNILEDLILELIKKEKKDDPVFKLIMTFLNKIINGKNAKIFLKEFRNFSLKSSQTDIIFNLIRTEMVDTVKSLKKKCESKECASNDAIYYINNKYWCGNCASSSKPIEKYKLKDDINITDIVYKALETEFNIFFKKYIEEYNTKTSKFNFTKEDSLDFFIVYKSSLIFLTKPFSVFRGMFMGILNKVNTGPTVINQNINKGIKEFNNVLTRPIILPPVSKGGSRTKKQIKKSTRRTRKKHKKRTKKKIVKKKKQSKLRKSRNLRPTR